MSYICITRLEKSSLSTYVHYLVVIDVRDYSWLVALTHISFPAIDRHASQALQVVNLLSEGVVNNQIKAHINFSKRPILLSAKISLSKYNKLLFNKTHPTNINLDSPSIKFIVLRCISFIPMLVYFETEIVYILLSPSHNIVSYISPDDTQHVLLWIWLYPIFTLHS